MTDDLAGLWRTAAEMDATLKTDAADLRKLAARRITSEPYARPRLFSQMTAGRPVIFNDFVVALRGGDHGDVRNTLVELYRKGFPRTQRARVQTGPMRYRSRIPVRELLDRWQRGRAIISVTDLHLRGTRVEEVMDVSGLSDYNLLLTGSRDMAYQEIMTLVIGAKGNVTDSHSDDPDGSNHSFLGRKLWLAWETFEGRAAGLEDNSRDFTTDDEAAFDMKAFLSLRSACWFTISAGETLFLPGRLTHKVLTLEHYLGVGSFYVALPCAINTITRWTLHRALWTLKTRDNDHLVGEITRAITKKVRELRFGSQELRDQWGYDFMQRDLDEFDALDAATKDRLQNDRDFANMIAEARASRAGAREADDRDQRPRRRGVAAAAMQ
jgi:hypothetical protein